MAYAEDAYLQIAEIQHFAFCPRQWALAYMENQWQENVLTVEGHALHDKAHDPALKEKRRDCIIVRGLRVSSAKLGVSGECDVVEFHKDDAGVHIPRYAGTYSVVPVEYKHGKPKTGEEDHLQLQLQAMCLEDMFCVDIPYGYIYYGAIRHREKVEFSQERRQDILHMLQRIRDYIRKGYTPRMKPRKCCQKCSLRELCLTRLQKQESVKSYLEKRLSE